MTIILHISWLRFLLVAAIVASAAGTTSAQGWVAQTSGTTEVLNGVWFIHEARGFAVGNAGTALETVDGGQSWSPFVLTADDLSDVAFLDEVTGLIVGDNGSIFRTANGGLTWAPVASGTTNNLAGVAFGGGGVAYAAGRDGTIVLSADVGASWTLVETGADRYRSVAAFGRRAWVVGDGGVVRATDDGGSNWFSLASGTASDLHDVVFVSELEGWVGGQNNTLLHTVDGGAGWTARNAGIGVGIDTLFFGNPELGSAAGGPGNVFGTTNGALTWMAEPTPTVQQLNGMHFTDAFHGWVVGDAGTVLTRVVPAVTLTVNRSRITWSAATGDVVYDVVRGDLEALRATAGDFTVATEECLAPATVDTFVEFLADPPLAGDGYWFLVRVDPAGARGTYDSGSFGQAGLRDVGIVSSGVDCP